MGVGVVNYTSRVGLLKADGATTADLPQTLDGDGGFKVHVQNPPAALPSNLRKEDGHGSQESNRSWGYVTEVDDDGNVLVGRKPAAASRPAVLSEEDFAKLEAIRLAIVALPAPPSTVTANQGASGTQSWKVVEDNSSTIAARLLNIYTSLQGQREVATSVWTDDSGAYYVRRDIIDESSGVPVISVTFTDEDGNPATPGVGLRPVGGSDREVTQVLYVATSGGTGYSSGDVLARLVILDASVSPPTSSAVWVNLTTGIVISTPTGGTYEDAGELVGIKGADQVTIATDANQLPVRDTTLKNSLEDRLGTLGRKAEAESAPFAFSTEDKTSVDAIKTAVEIMDDWDANDRAKVSPIPGQEGVAAGAGVTTPTTQRVVLTNDHPSIPVADAGLGTDGATPPVVGTGVRGWLATIWTWLVSILAKLYVQRPSEKPGRTYFTGTLAFAGASPVPGTAFTMTPVRPAGTTMRILTYNVTQYVGTAGATSALNQPTFAQFWIPATGEVLHTMYCPPPAVSAINQAGTQTKDITYNEPVKVADGAEPRVVAGSSVGGAAPVPSATLATIIGYYETPP